MLGHHRPASETPLAFRWWTDDDLFIVVFGSSIPSSTKKNSFQIWTPSDKTFWIRACIDRVHRIFENGLMIYEGLVQSMDIFSHRIVDFVNKKVVSNFELVSVCL